MKSDDDEPLREALPERDLLSRLRADTDGVIDQKTHAKASLYIPDALIRLSNAAPGECNWRLPDLGPNVPSALVRAIALATKKLRDRYLLGPPEP